MLNYSWGKSTAIIISLKTSKIILLLNQYCFLTCFVYSLHFVVVDVKVKDRFTNLKPLIDFVLVSRQNVLMYGIKTKDEVFICTFNHKSKDVSKITIYCFTTCLRVP